MIPPDNLIAGFYMQDGMKKQKIMTGKYRLCEKTGCETYITCPYSTCIEHWKPMRKRDECTDFKEWKGCDCNGKYNTDTFKCAVCKVN